MVRAWAPLDNAPGTGAGWGAGAGSWEDFGPINSIGLMSEAGESGATEETSMGVEDDLGGVEAADGAGTGLRLSGAVGGETNEDMMREEG